MLVTIRIADETYEKYGQYDKSNPRSAIEKQVERFKDEAPSDRVVILSPEVRRKLEGFCGTSIEDQGKFLKWFEERLNFKVNEVGITLRDGQLKSLRGIADHYKRPVSEVVKERVQQAIDRELGVY